MTTRLKSSRLLLIAGGRAAPDSSLPLPLRRYRLARVYLHNGVSQEAVDSAPLEWKPSIRTR